MKSPRVAIWARVSTEEQDTTNQVRQLQDYCQQRGWEVVQCYEVKESAWSTGAEYRLKRLYLEAQARKLDIALVWALDRLSRGGPLETLQVVDKLSRYNVRVISYREPWTEVDGPALSLLLAITGWVAQQESEQRSQRTKAGLARARAEGRIIGRPKQIGYVDLQFVADAKSDGHGWRWIQEHHPRTQPTNAGGYKRPTTTTIRAAWAKYTDELSRCPACQQPTLVREGRTTEAAIAWSEYLHCTACGEVCDKPPHEVMAQLQAQSPAKIKV